MPAPDRDRPGPRLTRRAVLVSAVAVGAVGCTPPRRGLDRRRQEEEPAPVEPQVDPDVAVAAEVLAAQNAVLALVRATADRHPALAGPLAPVVAAHEAHAALLDDAVPPEATAAPSPTTSGSPGGAGTAAAPGADASEATPTVPGNRRRALRRVVTAEQDLATRTKQQAFKAQSGAFARVLGSMAASAAQHAAVLEPDAQAGAS